MNTDRERRVVETFVTLADTLPAEFDPLELMSVLAERAVELLGVSGAGVILVDGRGGLSVAAASSERSRLLEAFAVAIDGGPCVQCVRTGEAVSSADIAGEPERWPRFAAGAAEAGFGAVDAIPMRRYDDVVGVLTLLNAEPRVLDERDRVLGQGLADVAAISLLSERAVRHAETAAEQLQLALNSRVIIEQAKGVLAAKADISPDEAFQVLRGHARYQGRRLTPLCRDVVEGVVDLTPLVRTREP